MSGTSGTEEGPSTQSATAPRAHRKSRKGCRTCKDRKIKCDERHPLCDNCKIYYQGARKSCDWGLVQLPATSEGSSGTSSDVVPVRRKPVRAIASMPPAIGSEKLDPFSLHPPTTARDPDRLLRHCLATCVFNMFPWTPDAEMSTPHQEYAHFVYSDPILYHVTLQLGAIQLEKEKHQKGLRQSKQLMAECLRMLRERIAHFTETGEAVDDQTICAVASLAAIEHQKGNVRMVQMHMEGLKRMAILRGGLGALRKTNPTVANMVFCTFIAADDTSFPITDLLSGYEKPAWYLEALPEMQGPQFVDFRDYGVHDSFANCLVDLRVLNSGYLAASDCSDASIYLDVLTLLCSILQRLLSLPPVGVAGTTENAIAESCRSGAAVYVLSAWKGHQPDPTLMVSKAQHHLKTYLTPLMAQPGNPVLLWLLCAGAVCALGTPERTWFVGHLAAMAQEVGIASYAGLRELLHRVVWQDHQDEPTHRVLWDETAELIKDMDD